MALWDPSMHMQYIHWCPQNILWVIVKLFSLWPAGEDNPGEILWKCCWQSCKWGSWGSNLSNVYFYYPICYVVDKTLSDLKWIIRQANCHISTLMQLMPFYFVHIKINHYQNREQNTTGNTNHDDVIKWKHFPCYWPFVRGIHRSPVNSPHKGQWRGALMSSLICVWINDWVNNRVAGDLRRYRAHNDVIVMT